MDLKSKIREIEGFPKEGINFKDITTLLLDGAALKYTIDQMADSLEGLDCDIVIGPEARGFIFGTALSYATGLPFAPIRKPGKLPDKTESYSYDLEYGTDTLQIHLDAIKPGDKVVLVDDLLATSGTITAAAKLVEKLGGEVVKIIFLIELEFLHGREKLKDYNITSLVKYDY